MLPFVPARSSTSLHLRCRPTQQRSVETFQLVLDTAATITPLAGSSCPGSSCAVAAGTVLWSAVAVNACSPPDINVSRPRRLPGGQA